MGGAQSYRKFRTEIRVLLILGAFVLPLCCSSALQAQGGPPFYTTDPGTPGPNSWEINLAYMPFLYSDSSTSHVPDVDINYGVGERIQLTYESAWLRVKDGGNAPIYGMEQSNPGFKWRFYDNEEKGFALVLGFEILPRPPERLRVQKLGGSFAYGPGRVYVIRRSESQKGISG